MGTRRADCGRSLLAAPGRPTSRRLACTIKPKFQLSRARQEIVELEEQVEKLAGQVAWFKRQMFGRKSEHLTPDDPESQAMFSLEDTMIEMAAPPPKPRRRPRGGSRKGRRTRALRLPPDLPVREETIIPMMVQEQPDAYRRSGEEVSQHLELEPDSFFRQRTIRPTYVSRRLT